MAIPDLSNFTQGLILCVSKKRFESIAIPALLLFVGKDDNGNSDKKSAVEYDNMVNEIIKAVKKFPDKKILSKANIKSILKIIQKSKPNLTNNKSKYISDFEIALDAVAIKKDGMIDQTSMYASWREKEWSKETTRDIVCYTQALINIEKEVPDVKNSLKCAAKVLSARKKSSMKYAAEIKREGAQPIIDKYL